VRSALQEAWEIIKAWWLFVTGVALGVVAIVQVIESAPGESVWFWSFCAMTAFFLAACWRLRGVVKERNQARSALAEEGTRDAVAHRMDRFVHEWEILRDEAPGEQEGVGPVNTDEQAFWGSSVDPSRRADQQRATPERSRVRVVLA